LFWPRQNTLVIADPHFGKPEAFRSAGIPVPGCSNEPLSRLAAAVVATAAVRLVVLGDFWHARSGRTESVMDELAAWRAKHPDLLIQLIRGNHDRAGQPPLGWGEWHVSGLAEPPFAFTHFPEPSEGGYVLAGHLHPSIVIEGRGHQRLRLPCFWFGQEVGVLPAFGMFTGAANVTIRPRDRVYAIAGDAVIETTRT
jgi:DNA ligase-associated metallophosphoesterase